MSSHLEMTLAMSQEIDFLVMLVLILADLHGQGLFIYYLSTRHLITREHVTFAGPHPPTPSPNLGEGEPSHLKVPLPIWERDLG
ncbi:hypothetical protein [Leptodesmis sichuanensis]|uniref:hypothetical protein n=1 Tax=Leptodesmis sichuanensis TaxID=2906798 RepID=UPI001F3DAA6C|nr:hypothetical protein [Leptodesmis sichuanensis]UIE39859.1 hypothetical protein KIK02_10020 [Leptodesmis sichuanensis A121]